MGQWPTVGVVLKGHVQAVDRLQHQAVHLGPLIPALVQHAPGLDLASLENQIGQQDLDLIGLRNLDQIIPQGLDQIGQRDLDHFSGSATQSLKIKETTDPSCVFTQISTNSGYRWLYTSENRFTGLVHFHQGGDTQIRTGYFI